MDGDFTACVSTFWLEHLTILWKSDATECGRINWLRLMCEPLHFCLEFWGELVDRHASIAATLLLLCSMLRRCFFAVSSKHAFGHGAQAAIHYKFCRLCTDIVPLPPPFVNTPFPIRQALGSLWRALLFSAFSSLFLCLSLSHQFVL